MTDKKCDESNVVELGKRLELRPTNTADLHLVVKRDGSYCQHKPVIVDERQRCVYCSKCKAPLDPFAELLKIANEHERHYSDMKRKKEETRGAQTRLDLLKRLEDNTRARLRKLGVKTTTYWLDGVLDWLERRASGRHPEPLRERNWLQYELESAPAPTVRLGMALKAIEDGVGLPAIEMASQVLEEMRAALDSEAQAMP